MSHHFPWHTLARLGMILAVALVLFPLNVRPAAAQSTIVVNSNADPGSGGCTLAECTLREAIAAAPAGATISFSVKGVIQLTQGQLTIDKNLALSGPERNPIVVQGQPTSRVLQVTNGSTVALSWLTLFGGNAGAGDGGGILNGGMLTLNDTKVAFSEATNGAGIANSGTLTINGGEVSYNLAIGNGGGILSRGPIQLNNTAVNFNTGLSGGGVYLVNNQEATITGSTISNNSAVATSLHPRETLGGGGGVYSFGERLVITSSTIANNSSQENGGGVLLVYGKLELQHTTISGNTAAYFGGGIAHELFVALDLGITASTLTGNRARSGGGIYSSGIPYPRDGLISRTIIAGNSATESDPDIGAHLLSSGYNLIGIVAGDRIVALDRNDPSLNSLWGSPTAPIDPGLGPLVNNADATATHLPQPGSLALNAIPAEHCVGTVDQRGVSRPQGGRCDIGAAELELVNRQPTVSIEGPDELDEGSNSTFRAVGSDPDGDALSYSWTLDTGTVIDGSGDQVVLLPIHFPGPGPRTLTVRASDPAGAVATSSLSLFVRNMPPTATFSAPTQVEAGQPFNLTLLDGRDPGGQSMLTFAFDCGDGKGFLLTGRRSSTSCATAGGELRRVGAWISDEEGAMTEYSAEVLVLAPKPVPDQALCYASGAQNWQDYLPGLRKDGKALRASHRRPALGLGLPQMDNTKNFVTLGFGGSLTLSFSNPVVNDGTAAPDLRIWETTINDRARAWSKYPEAAKIYASADGATWTLIGTTTDKDQSYDLVLPEAKFIRLQDSSDPKRFKGADDGFDLDGVEVLSGCVPPAR